MASRTSFRTTRSWICVSTVVKWLTGTSRYGVPDTRAASLRCRGARARHACARSQLELPDALALDEPHLGGREPRALLRPLAHRRDLLLHGRRERDRLLDRAL